MINDSQQLGVFLKENANCAEAHLSFDTHYDAQNWELSWWRNSTLHRLDFQPLDHGKLSITHYQDHFRFFARLLRWTHNAIPLFPYAARIEWENVAMEKFPLQEEKIEAMVSHSIHA